MKRAGLIGDPVSHSLSRVMHNAAFDHVGIVADYQLWETPLAELDVRVESLREAEVLGANVTVPHKQAVMPLLDEFSSVAKRVGAVNTIIPTGGGLLGDNTDAYGFARSLAEVFDGATVDHAVVVGAGGASRAVLVALQDAGVGRIVLVNRTTVKASELANQLGGNGLPEIVVAEMNELARVAKGAQVIVNATSVGWHGEELPFGGDVLDGLSTGAVVADLTYRETSLLKLATLRNLVPMDGLPMLIHQGAKSFELWTGVSAPLDVMRLAVQQEQRLRAL